MTRPSSALEWPGHSVGFNKCLKALIFAVGGFGWGTEGHVLFMAQQRHWGHGLAFTGNTCTQAIGAVNNVPSFAG